MYVCPQAYLQNHKTFNKFKTQTANKNSQTFAHFDHSQNPHNYLYTLIDLMVQNFVISAINSL